MKPSIIAHTRFVCHLCQFTRRKPTTKAFSILAQPARRQIAARSIPSIEPTHKRQRRHYATATDINLRALQKAQEASDKAPATVNASNLEENLKWITDTTREILSSETVPDEASVLEVLIRAQELANVVMLGTAEHPDSRDKIANQQGTPDASSTSSLLDLEDDELVSGATATSSSALSIPTRQRAKNIIASTLYDLLRDHKVFITPPALDTYTRTQLFLGRPQYLPAIFDLYATKPIPKANSFPITYSQPWKSHPKNAIDTNLSSSALDAAIGKKDLPLALAIIDTTVATPAFRIAKAVRKAALPIAAFCALPFAAYTGADWLAHYQNTMDEGLARTHVLLASTAYVGTMSIIGFIAITTYNDNFERVSWQPGYRLRDRWLHEEERYYFDRVAMAWGFKEKWRRGEEQGEEWEALREFLGRRSMVLDRSSLLEGME